MLSCSSRDRVSLLSSCFSEILKGDNENHKQLKRRGDTDTRFSMFNSKNCKSFEMLHKWWKLHLSPSSCSPSFLSLSVSLTIIYAMIMISWFLLICWFIFIIVIVSLFPFNFNHSCCFAISFGRERKSKRKRLLICLFLFLTIHAGSLIYLFWLLNFWFQGRQDFG